MHRISRSEGFVRAYKGFWEDDHTFLIAYEVIDYTERGGVRITFEDEVVTFWAHDVIEGEKHELIGRRQD